MGVIDSLDTLSEIRTLSLWWEMENKQAKESRTQEDAFIVEKKGGFY
jgi:hypothetical protein